MRLTFVRTFSFLVAVFFLNRVAFSATSSSAADSLAEFREAGGFAMQADMKSAVPHLQRVNPDDLSGERRTAFLCMRARFVEKQTPQFQDSIDHDTAEVLRVYREYWTRVMFGAVSSTDAERGLAATLTKLVVRGPGKSATLDMDALELLLKTQLEQRGFHALFGVTSPLREFMAWRKENESEYNVDLPEGRQTVHIVFMDDFISFGWLGYATCDYRHTGGWAKTDKLFAVRSAYDLDSESFKVSYLAHEGQHFSDYQHHPGMEQPDLEYRAKLVEISKANSSLYDLLDDFASNESESREQAHPWANRQVVNNLAAKLLKGEKPSPEAWKHVTIAQLNAAASQLLEQDSKQRVAAKGKS
jgi:hypothetical protein